MTSDGLRYRAFLSYSHRDEVQAQRLHRRLETWSVPRALRGTAVHGAPLGARLGPVFRDREELASAGSLSQAIREALDAAAALIVLCSPAAVASPWVAQEIAYFRRQHPDRPVLAFVVAGEPGADPAREPQRAAFPLPLLLHDVDNPAGARGEPIAADAREQGDGFAAAFLKLVAGLLSLRYDQLRQRELRRRQRRWAAVAALSCTLTLVFAVLAVQALRARDAARAAQARAELELTSERQTREFLLSVFHLADANEARGNSVTVREVLDRAVAGIDRSEFSRAAIRARFLASMGQAYSSLGLNKRGAELLRRSIDDLGQDAGDDAARSQRNDSRLELAALAYSMGDYDEATRQLDAVAAEEARLEWAQRVRLHVVRGDVLAYTEHDAEAQAAYRTALEALAAAPSGAREAVLLRARALSGQALLAQFGGDNAGAERGYAQVVELLQAEVGETHPDTIAAVISLGSCAFQKGDREAARRHWLRALAAARQVFDPGNPQIATIENNLGRLLLETGDLTGAEPLLRDALASDRRHMAADFDDLAYPLYNLAYVRYARGDAAEARQLLDEALPIAAKSRHRMYGPILSTLADLHCRGGDASAGAELAAQAEGVGDEQAEAAPWYAAQARLTRQYCRAVGGATPAAFDAEAAVATVTAKWGSASPFARRAREQAQVIAGSGAH